MFKRMLLLMLTALLALPVIALADSDYYITVDVVNQITTVYQHGTGEDHIVRQMICSTGAPDSPTMIGTYTMVPKRDGDERSEWYHVSGGLVKWATRIKWGTLFHSVPYNSKSSGYNAKMAAAMGTPASHGCIRLWTEDAWWIAVHVPSGTRVTIFDDGVFDPELRDLLMQETFSIENGTYAQFMKGHYTLRKGNESERVQELQQRLKLLGYDCGEADGEFGADTETAVLSFQKANGLEQTGTVPESVWQAVFSQQVIPSPIRLGVSGLHVFQLQQALKKLGFYNGEMNSACDATTWQALVNCRRARGLEEAGDVDYQELIELEALSQFGALGEAKAQTPMARLKAEAVLRTFPGDASPAVTVLSAGEQVTMLEIEGEWIFVRCGARGGYLPLSVLDMN